ncbi:MAG: hypothetical protein F9K40_04235 [Kofleriaceae bacterium]|nr:MAG: hypothetical protein F9K40_04235 [Kofleriaceae bacterium]MBZ0233510.1 DUF5985 family protein [Kofleriaceae bacterium]
MSDSLRLILFGGLIASCFFASVFFFRFWSRTRDRFHLFFASAMILLGVNWGAVAATTTADSEPHSELYLARLLAFVLILVAIVDRNRRK